uniref:Secreted protein n=1 Tax=Heterorhabditis bacteriophora TaxID=37862 RepID=A0A1I7XB75_HETBA
MSTVAAFLVTVQDGHHIAVVILNLLIPINATLHLLPKHSIKSSCMTLPYIYFTIYI